MSLEAVSKFKFVSPGVFVDEIDQSQLPKLPARMGPVIVGRAERGPGLRPVLLNSYSEFVEMFGNPIGGGKYNDTWRNGNFSAPTYAGYAVQAYLRHSNPVTFVRLVGAEHSTPDTSGDTAHEQSGKAGWQTANAVSNATTGGGAYGLFVIPSGTVGTRATAVDCIDTTGYVASAADASFTILIPTANGGLGGTAVTILLDIDKDDVDQASAADNTITIGTKDGTDAQVASFLVNVINGVTAGRFVYASEGNGQAGHDLGVTAALTAPGATTITLTMDQPGTAGDIEGALANTVQDVVKVTDFSNAAAGTQAALTGTLAAVWYLEQGTIELSGVLRDTEHLDPPIQASGSSVMIKSTDNGNTEWKVIIKDGLLEKQVESAFNFNPNSHKYIRKVFNTDPQLVNSQIFTSDEGLTNYWLGDSYERAVADKITTADPSFGTIVALSDGASPQNEYSDMNKPYLASETGWFISQDLVSGDDSSFDPTTHSTRTKKLFKLISLDCGSEWNQNNLKVSIQDIRPGKSKKNWPKFSVVIRKLEDNDKRMKIVERFSNVNLNPVSPDYIGRRIGTRYLTYDSTLRRFVTHGDYANVSRWVRVEVNKGLTKEEYPFGVYGPWRFKGFTAASGTAVQAILDSQTFIECGDATIARAYDQGDEDVGANKIAQNNTIYCGTIPMSASFEFPAVPLRQNGTDGNIIDQKRAYWGVDVSQTGNGVTTFEQSTKDVLRNKPLQNSTSDFDQAGNAYAEYSWIFTLDDVQYDPDAGNWTYTSGSRVAGNSYTSLSGSDKLLTGSEAGIDKFTTVFYGGFDGLDITEREPFRNTYLADGTDRINYAYNTLNQAIDLVKDAEKVECNLMAIPGVTNRDITKRLITTCEERADALAVIDIERDYVPDTEHNANTSEASSMGDVDEAVARIKDRDLDSSYGCCYYPWVQVKDSVDGTSFWAPPSVVALGSMAYTESRKDVWFAPAGFSRGGLTETNAGGVTVSAVRQDLTSKQRDQLYEVGINPIASFPAEGIVIFGQKTLQSVQSALDRVNVRRLLIFLKKEISRIASRTLFEQNVQETWNAFSGEVDNILSAVQTRLGLTDYRLILDETTTTDELVDRNILYAKIYLKPARSIEFIALDFIITSSGASFED